MDKNRMAGIILKVLLVEMAGNDLIRLDLRKNQVKLVGTPTDSPRTFNFAFQIHPKRMGAVNGFYSPRFQRTVSQGIRQATQSDGDFEVRPTTAPSGAFMVEVSKPAQLWDKVTLQSVPKGHGLIIPLGINSVRRPVQVDLSDPDTPHVLIAGKTGSGKTNNMHQMIWRLIMQNQPEAVRFVCIDAGKNGRDFRVFQNSPYLACDLVTDQHTAAQVVDWLLLEKKARNDYDNPIPHIFVFVDEATELDKSISDKLATLTRTARSANIHILSIFHNPTKDNVGNRDIVTNSGLRMVGKVSDSTAAKVAMGVQYSGAERLTGKGDVLVLNTALSADPMRVTAPLVVEGDYEVLPRGEFVPLMDSLPAVKRTGPGRPEDEVTPSEYVRYLAHFLQCLKEDRPPVKAFSVGRSEKPYHSESKSNRGYSGAMLMVRELKKRGVL